MSHLMTQLKAYIQGWELANPQRSFTLCALRGWVKVYLHDFTIPLTEDMQQKVGTVQATNRLREHRMN
ncbi:Bahcc1 [Gossypium australe]|uniref:Bahcc1 n=1 Tax=Gossypium australe TaxID=47621 RepID=A0A5B6UA99_9ROSI|nr:Bahcc1 [Gossypium australe]